MFVNWMVCGICLSIFWFVGHVCLKIDVWDFIDNQLVRFNRQLIFNAKRTKPKTPYPTHQTIGAIILRTKIMAPYPTHLINYVKSNAQHFNNRASFVQIFIYITLKILLVMVKKIVTFFLCLLLITNFIFIIMPKPSSAVMPPVVNIKWAEGQHVQEADVGPGQSGIVTFSGTVSADLAPAGQSQDVYVCLHGSTDQGWPVTVTPAEVLLQPGTEEAPFSATVAVTPETSYHTMGSLTVGGTASVIPGSQRDNIPSTTATIKIKQFYRFYMTSDRPCKQAVKGNNLVYNLSVNNIGNANDKFGLFLYKNDKLNDSELKIQFLNQVEAKSKSHRSISVKIKTSSETKPGKYEVNLYLKSIYEECNEGYSEPASFTIVIFIKDNYVYSISIIFTIIFIIIFLVLIIKKLKPKIHQYLNKPEPEPRIPPID